MGGDEYWIHADGSLTYCDGDAGAEVPNHAAVVRSWLLEELLSAAADVKSAGLRELFVSGLSLSQQPVLDMPEIRQYLNDTSDAMARDGRLPQEDADDYDTAFVRQSGIDPLVYDMFFERCSEKLKDWAVLRWNWIAVRCHNIDLRRPDLATLARLQDGLATIYPDDWERLTYNVDVREPRRYFASVPGTCLGNFRAIVKSQREPSRSS